MSPLLLRPEVRSHGSEVTDHRVHTESSGPAGNDAIRHWVRRGGGHSTTDRSFFKLYEKKYLLNFAGTYMVLLRPEVDSGIVRPMRSAVSEIELRGLLP